MALGGDANTASNLLRLELFPAVVAREVDMRQHLEHRQRGGTALQGFPACTVPASVGDKTTSCRAREMRHALTRTATRRPTLSGLRRDWVPHGLCVGGCASCRGGRDSRKRNSRWAGGSPCTTLTRNNRWAGGSPRTTLQRKPRSALVPPRAPPICHFVCVPRETPRL